jgi:hypothetical protein
LELPVNRQIAILPWQSHILSVDPVVLKNHNFL